MKKLFILFSSLALLLFGLVACKDYEHDGIVATNYAQYSLAKEIVKDEVKVKLLTDPGASMHGYEFSSKNVSDALKSKIFLATGNDQNELNLIKRLKPEVIVINFKQYFYEKHEVDVEHKNHDHDHNPNHNHALSHYWTSISNLIDMSTLIHNAAINNLELTNNSKELITSNYQNLKNKLGTIKAEFHTYLAEKEINTIFFAGHNSFEAFEIEFGINIHSLIPDIKDDLSETAKDMTTLVNGILENNAETLYVPELVNPSLPESIIKSVKAKNENLNLEVLELNGYHNITKKQYNENLSIITLIEQNISNLKKGL